MSVAYKIPAEYANTVKNIRHAHFQETVNDKTKRISHVTDKTPILKSGLTNEEAGSRPRSATPNARHGLSEMCSSRPRAAGPDRHTRKHEEQAHNNLTHSQRPKSGVRAREEPLLHTQLGLSKLGMEELTRKDGGRANIRPLSAPVTEERRKRRRALKSAKGRYGTRSDERKDQSDEK